MTRRTERISSLIRQEISELLREQVNDPRLRSLISITRVFTSVDLTHARVYFSIFGEEVSKGEVLEGFAAASGFLRRQLASRLRLKHMPELSFHLDESIEKGARVLKLIDELASEETGEESED